MSTERSIFDSSLVEQVRGWLESHGEVFVVARYSHASGSKDYFLFNQFESLQNTVSKFPERTDVCVFRDPQLTYRGTAGARFQAQAFQLWKSPDEWFVSPLVFNTALECRFWEDDPQDLIDAFQDFQGKVVAFGRHPKWWVHDHAGMVSGLVPSPDGTLKRGVY